VLGSGADTRALLLATAAPGQFRAREADLERFVPGTVFEGRVLATWQESVTGYNVEARVPIGLTADALGVGIVDVDRAGAGYTVEVAATWGSERATASALVYERPRVRALIEQFASVGGRFRVLDRNGWVIATTGALREPAQLRPEREAGLVEQAFRSVLGRDDPPYAELERPVGRLGDAALRGALEGQAAAAWFGRGPSDAAVVAAAVPVRRAAGSTGNSARDGDGDRDGDSDGDRERIVGAVLLEQASDPILTLTNGALVRLIGATLTVSVAAALALLGYATFLSVRVRRLARAAETALGPRGEINVALPGRKAGDEIGDLARSFADLLRRLRDYTDYLRTLTSKLAHELRTPLAIVTTSLDNLEHEMRDASTDAYVGRLREGAGRLESILSAMSAATRIEQAVAEAAAEPFDLRSVLVSCAGAYADIHAARRFVCRAGDAPARVVGSSELFAQLLDKLVENAVSFSPEGSEIVLALTEVDSEYEVSVTNDGPLLPESMRHQLFDSLVSVRPERDERPHLGLGLYIVALIADFHGGRVAAHNRADEGGVTMRAFFPLS
jgi:two-component system, OmpR family, sensor histidine kinase ChvG